MTAKFSVTYHEVLAGKLKVVSHALVPDGVGLLIRQERIGLGKLCCVGDECSVTLRLSDHYFEVLKVKF